MIFGGPLINDEFPNLHGSTQFLENFDLYEYIDDSWAIIMMHPSDFTPVCTTELGEVAKLSYEFEKRNIKICGYSCNDVESHRLWIKDVKAATGGTVKFPLFCDPQRKNARHLGILDTAHRDNRGNPLPLRNLFILNPDKTVALTMSYPMSTGRNFSEILRVTDSLQLAYNTNHVCTPANWKQGDDVIVDVSLTDASAEETFDKVGYKIVDVPSESGKELHTHYLRYTKDPST